MTQVVIADTTKGIRACLDEIFGAFGGIGKVIPKNGGRVYVKPNAVHFTPFAYTDIDVMDAMLGYLNDNGYNRISVMEGSTGGNFTRLAYKIIGYTNQLKLSGVPPLKLCPCNPLSAAFSLLQAKLHGLNATVPPLLG